MAQQPVGEAVRRRIAMLSDKTAQYGHGFASVATTAWVGSMWAVGYLAVPILFHALPENRQLAGMLAGEMFSAVGYLGMACGALISMYLLAKWGKQAWRQTVLWVVAVMLLLVCIGQFGIQPAMAELKAQALPLEVMHSAVAARFKLLHGISSVLYLVQSLLGAVLVLKIRRC